VLTFKLFNGRQKITVPERGRFQAYEIMNNICPTYLHSYVTFTHEIHSKN